MQNIKTGFIGSGNMARALIGGLRASGVNGSRIYTYDPDAARLRELCRDFELQACADNQALLETCDVIVLAIKPQAMRAVIKQLTPPGGKKLFLSIAAGLRTDAINRWFGSAQALVRAMPNTPALVRAGATGMYATPQVSSAQREIAEHIMRAVGITVWVENETQLDAVTALSGSGPAYYFYLMEAMEAAGIKLGLPAETARLLTIQTAFGAAKLALEVEEEPRVLRERVTSPGGTTERAIQYFDNNKASAMIEGALTAASERAAELAELLEKES